MENPRISGDSGAENSAGEIIDEVGQIAQPTLSDLRGLEHHHRRVVGDPRTVSALGEIIRVSGAESGRCVLTYTRGELPNRERQIPFRGAERGPLPVDQSYLAKFVEDELGGSWPGVGRHRVGGQGRLEIEGPVEHGLLHAELAAEAPEPIDGRSVVAEDILRVDPHDEIRYLCRGLVHTSQGAAGRLDRFQVLGQRGEIPSTTVGDSQPRSFFGRPGSDDLGNSRNIGECLQGVLLTFRPGRDRVDLDDGCDRVGFLYAEHLVGSSGQLPNPGVRIQPLDESPCVHACYYPCR